MEQNQTIKIPTLHCSGCSIHIPSPNYLYSNNTGQAFALNPLCQAECRTIENYSESISFLDENPNEKSHQGIKFDSVFNRLKYFHVCRPGLPPCLGHDLFEGVVAYDLALFVKYLVKTKKWFTYDHINGMIRNIAFKEYDARDTPVELRPNGDKLSGHAVQNWRFLRNFPLLVLSKVADPNDKTWNLILLLRTIVEYVCAPRISSGQVAYLKVLTEQYLEGRKANFPDVPLRPKHHYMLHYAELIQKWGPLMRTWTLRFESKHSYFRQDVRFCPNFINITKSLSTKHQLFQAYCSQGQRFHEKISADKSIPFHVDLYREAVSSAVEVCGEQSGAGVYISDSVLLKNTEYRKGMYVVVKCDDAEDGIFTLQLGCIQAALISNDWLKCHFIVEMSVGHYITKLGLYQVTPMLAISGAGESSRVKKMHCIDSEHLTDYQPLNAYDQNRSRYITLKHALLSLGEGVDGTCVSMTHEGWGNISLTQTTVL